MSWPQVRPLSLEPKAGVAQLAERLPCKEDVAGSMPVISSIHNNNHQGPQRG